MNLIESLAFKFKENNHESDANKNNHDKNFDCKKKLWLKNSAISTQKCSYSRNFWLWKIRKIDVLFSMKWWIEMNEYLIVILNIDEDLNNFRNRYWNYRWNKRNWSSC